MSSDKLQAIQTVKTIKERKEILQEYLQKNPIGDIPDKDNNILIWLFDTYYTPDIGHTKYTMEEIDRFYIGLAKFNSPCFHLRLKNGEDDVATYKRLAGENRTNNENLQRALRYAIESQIEDFRRTHSLNPHEICPIEKKPVGQDAQVDHFNPTFKRLVQDWIQQNPNPEIEWGKRGSSIYLLKEPFHTSWVEYHRNNAHLRWLSKEGNKKAHKM